MEKNDVKTFMEDPEISEQIRPEDLPLKKRIFYASMIKTFGNVSQSCMIAGIKRATYRKWLKEDPAFYELIEGGDFEERLLDFAESKLVSKLNDGDIIAILFTLKTKGKRRGYIEGNNVPPKENMNKIPTWFDAPPKEIPASKDTRFIEDAIITEETKNDQSGKMDA
jgi:hypothetical protein